MHILAFVLYFIIGSIDAATKGDWSGFEAMGKFLLYAGLFILMAFLLLNPALLIIGIIILVVIVACCNSN